MNTTSFLDELQKISQAKTAVDPASIAAFLAGAKATSLATNVLRRHGLKIPLVGRAIKRIGAGAVGVGARQGAMGYPMVSRPVREAVALLEPSLVKAYEAGHSLGAGLGPQKLVQAKNVAGRLQQELAKRNPLLANEVKGFSDIIEKANLRPAASDILFSPVGEAVRTIRGYRPAATNVRKALKADQAIKPHVKFPSEIIQARDAAKRVPPASLGM